MAAQSPSWSMAMRCSASRCRSTLSVLVAIATTGCSCRAAARPARAAMNWSPGPIRWSAGQAEADDVDLEQGLAHQVVEPLARAGSAACAAPGCRRGSAGALGPVTMPRMVCRVVCGLRDVIATLLPDQGVGQGRLAGVGPADEAGEARERTCCSVAALIRPRGVRCQSPASARGAGSATRSTMTVAMPVPTTGHPLGGQARARATSQRGADDRHPADGLADAARRRCRPRPPRASTSNSSARSSTCSVRGDPAAGRRRGPRPRAPRGRTRR